MMVTSNVVQNWDDPQPGANWDSGLQWDINVGDAPGDITPYTRLITSEHNQKPKYMAMLRAVFQPISDDIFVAQNIYSDFDLDSAVGEQLDIVGLWVGVGRFISAPLTSVYFTLDDPALGFDTGTWFSEFDPVSGLIRLPDEDYRTLLRARIANNQWDGTIPGAYEIWDTLFAGTGIGILIIDLGNMHMLLALTGSVPNAVTLALFRGGFLDLKPAGVMVDAYITPTVPDAPYFGFDISNESVSGFDIGAWGSLS